MLRALETLEASRAVRLMERDAFAVRRHAEKAAGRRTPRRIDTARMRGPRWPGDEAPSRLGLVAAVANGHTTFKRFPYPDESLYRNSQAQQLAGLHACLDSCADSYLTNLGHVDAVARDALAEAIREIEHLVRPGYAPLNGHLLVWLRFANLLAYATAARLGH